MSYYLLPSRLSSVVSRRAGQGRAGHTVLEVGARCPGEPVREGLHGALGEEEDSGDAVHCVEEGGLRDFAYKAVNNTE